jgi:hypothetical protein
MAARDFLNKRAFSKRSVCHRRSPVNRDFLDEIRDFGRAGHGISKQAWRRGAIANGDLP